MYLDKQEFLRAKGGRVPLPQHQIDVFFLLDIARIKNLAIYHLKCSFSLSFMYYNAIQFLARTRLMAANESSLVIS